MAQKPWELASGQQQSIIVLGMPYYIIKPKLHFLFTYYSIRVHFMRPWGADAGGRRR